jgi:outer membrane protein assembly factor BamB
MIALVLAAAAALLSSPANWTQFRLDDTNNAVVPGSLKATWRVNAQGPFSSSPTIAGGVLYVGDNAGELFAIDPRSGKVKWKAQFANALMSAPIVFGNVVIVGEGNEASPLGSAPNHPIRVGRPPNELIAVDRTTGAVVWRKTLPGSGMPMPAIINGLLIQHDGGGYIYALNPAGGATVWSVNAGSIASMSSILPFGGDRFVTTGVERNGVFMFSAKRGTSIWQSLLSPSAAGIGDCPVVTDGARIYCDYTAPPSTAIPIQTERSANFRAYAIDVRSGKRVWDTLLESGQLPKRNEAAIPLLYDHGLYVGSSVAPYLHAVDRTSGAVRWRFRAHGVIKGGIAAKNGVLYFGDYGGYVWAVNASTGALIGDVRAHMPFNVGSPVIAGETLVIGTGTGVLLAMPLSVIRSGRDR